MKKCIIEKIKKIHSEKTLNYFSGTVEKLTNICSRHNSMTELCRTLFKYENKMDMG